MNNNLTKIYIARHGEAEHNVLVEASKTYEPSLGYSAKLTKKGVLQAKDLANKLQDIYFDAIFSSDMARAKQTAEIVAIEKNIAVKTSQAIRERNFGSSEGKWHLIKKKVLEELDKLDEELKMHYVFDDEETNEQAVSRLITFVRETAIAYSGKTILIVCHGAIMRMFLIKLGFARFDEMPSGSIANTGYFVLESDGVDFFVKETYEINKKLTHE